jgi:acid stress-induced BolA-like protein IbaG/YrbA
MAKLTKNQLQRILTDGLHLKDPTFMLEKAGTRISGNVVSPSFKGQKDHERQKMIWDALEEKLGFESVKVVGMLLAYTPEEWNFGTEQTPKGRTRKVG